jgi:hypothetical protein
MSEDYVQVQPDSTGKKMRTYKHTVGANEVHEEVMQVAKVDGTKINPAQEDGNLATVAGDTTSIDGKITACNTGAVTISAALPAGANAIGKLAANSGVDIGDVDVTSQPSTLFLHDRKTYESVRFDAAASGNLKAAVASKVTKLHAATIQAQGTVTVNLNDGNGGASLMEWKLQDREGAVVPFASAPAYWAKTTANTALYVTLSAAVTVTITAIVSSDDAS